MTKSVVNVEKIGRDPVIPSNFGKDHWSTFAYLECRIVDNKGVPDKNHMRTDPERHPGMEGHLVSMAYADSREKYPTILRGGSELKDHDDWDCAYDLVAAGLLSEPADRGTGLNPVFRMTKKGPKVSGWLRAHKDSGGTFATFSAGGI